MNERSFRLHQFWRGANLDLAKLTREPLTIRQYLPIPKKGKPRKVHRFRLKPKPCAMKTAASLPHFLLFAEARVQKGGVGKWQFTLESMSDAPMLSAGDNENETSRDRLYLLALVRGLEALDQPSRVTLVTASRYVCRGLTRHLEAWKADRWCWEWDGQLAPIANVDLWKRVDKALCYHKVECRRWRFDPSHAEDPVPRPKRPRRHQVSKQPVAESHWLQRVVATFAT